MAGFTVGNTNIFTSNTFSATFNGLTVNNQLVFEAAPVFQGSVSGYTSGGSTVPTGPTSDQNTIDKFPFAVDTNASDVGDLQIVTRITAGQSSSENGYTSGGYKQTVGNLDSIQKFPFAVDTNATDIGNLSQARHALEGTSSSTSGYNSGGNSPPKSNVIDKFPFSSDNSATDVGDLTQTRAGFAASSSTTHGYSAGGGTPGFSNVIDKFPFSSDTGAADVGDLATDTQTATGQSSETDGYISGGHTPSSPEPTNQDKVEKYPFASDNNSIDVLNLTRASRDACGQSSTTSGYTTAGRNPTSTPTPVNTVDRFLFSTNSNATDVGDLTQGRYRPAGQQV